MYNVGDYVTHNLTQPMAEKAGEVGVITKITSSGNVVKFFAPERKLGYLQLLLKNEELFVPQTLPDKLITVPYFVDDSGTEHFEEVVFDISKMPFMKGE